MKKFKMIIDPDSEMYRIVAIINFNNVKKGEFGGLIEKERNLSHDNNAWVYGNARVYGNAWNKSPLYIQGSKHSLSNCKHGHIAIGCQCHSYQYWIENYKNIGSKQGYTEDEIKEYSEHIRYMIKMGK